MATQHKIVLEDVAKAFGSNAVLDGVNLEIERGESMAIIGQSGSGKSVTALSIMRLVQPPGRIAGGSIRFKGRELLELREKEMQAVRGADKTLISDVAVFDVFSGEAIGAGKKSVAIEITISPRERSLTEQEIEAISAKVVAQASKATGATLRS